MKLSHRQLLVASSALVLGVTVSACGRSADSSSGQASPLKGLVATTPAGTTTVPAITWAVYRNIQTLDPIYAYDYPENTALSLMCETLIRQTPGGAIGPGLATLSTPSPTQLVFTLRPGVRFWDGNPVTPQDVIYSLERNTNKSLGGYYASVFDGVKSMKATGPNQVTITTKRYDAWLIGELSAVESDIVEKSYVEKVGGKYGTPSGGIMCSGAYKFKSWSPGGGVVAVRNPHYWNPKVDPKVQQVTFKGVSDQSALTAGLISGSIQGTFYAGLSTLTQLEHNANVKVYQGPGQATDALVVASLHGVLGDVRVRQALSLALDRKSLIASVYHGAALIPHWLSNPGTFGYAKSVFNAAYNQTPAMTQNLAKAKELIKQAGAEGKTLVLGDTSGLATIATDTAAYQAAAEAIGLKVKLDSVSVNNYIDFFESKKARAGVDGFITQDYGDYAAPEAWLAGVVLPPNAGGDENYSGFSDPEITSLLNQSRRTVDPTQRAHLVSRAEELAAKELPWIPDAQPTTTVIFNKAITGTVSSFSYMNAPWADNIGGTG